MTTQDPRDETSREGPPTVEELFHQLMDNSPIYVFFKDDQVRSLYLSKNYEQMLGRPRDELIGKTMDDLFPSELAKNMVQDDLRILREGKVVEVEEELDGHHYQTTKFPIRPENRPPYLAGYTIDVTEQRRAEEIILKHQKLEALGVLAAGIAHDFNNLLTSIFGNIDLVLTGGAGIDEGQSGRPLLEAAMHAIHRARGLTRQLLTFASGGEPITLVGRLFPFVEQTARFALSGSNVVPRFSRDPDLWSCRYDRTQLGQVVENLVINPSRPCPSGVPSR